MRRILSLLHRVNRFALQQARGRQLPSLYFYTVHKCASTLFSEYILHHTRLLKPVDYADRIYNKGEYPELIFHSKGHLYGPIRVTSYPDGPLFEPFVKHVISQQFIANKHCLFFLRDPRDVIVSTYFSFGWSHPYSANPEVKDFQELNRSRIQSQSLSDFALSESHRANEQYRLLAKLITGANSAEVITYEEMIRGDVRFFDILKRNFHLKDAVVKECYERTRPVKTEDIHQHRRDGSIGGFRKKLDRTVIDEMNAILSESLNFFKYPE